MTCYQVHLYISDIWSSIHLYLIMMMPNCMMIICGVVVVQNQNKNMPTMPTSSCIIRCVWMVKESNFQFSWLIQYNIIPVFWYSSSVLYLVVYIFYYCTFIEYCNYLYSWYYTRYLWLSKKKKWPHQVLRCVWWWLRNPTSSFGYRQHNTRVSFSFYLLLLYHR